jgi:tetratricopeptide (TPR) repeat protein
MAAPREPELPDEIVAADLDPAVRRELRTLPEGLAETVARHLAAAGRLVDEDPVRAHAHALAARRRAARVPVVREAVGVTAYLSGRYAEALAELRAVRRMSGVAAYLPVMADCERGLGRPERALALAADPTGLDRAGQVELCIVAAGARRDLGQPDAAVLLLQGQDLRADTREAWLPRLRYAYADALAAAGRDEEARRWFALAIEVDPEGETDAAERAGEPSPVRFLGAGGE